MTSKTPDHATTRIVRCIGASNLLVILIILLHSGHSNSVQISGTRLGDSSATLASGVVILIDLLNNTELLKSLNDLAVDGAGGIDVVVWSRASVLGAAVDLAETADTDGLAEVDVAGDGSGADVEPVGRLRGQLVAVRGLDGVDPAWNRKSVLVVSQNCFVASAV